MTAPALSPALSAAVGRGTSWVWALDAAVVPDPAALEQLLAPLADDRELGHPVLLTSRIQTSDGQLEGRSLPYAEVRDPELILSAAERRVVRVRAARHGSLLVHRRSLERHGLPRAGRLGAGQDLEWTARMLRGETGLLVPASIAVRPHTSGRGSATEPRPDAVALLRLLLSDALRPSEKVWFSLRLVDAVLGRDRRAGPG